MLQLKLIRKKSAGWVIRIITLIMSMHNNKPFINRKKNTFYKKKSPLNHALKKIENMFL